MTISSRVLHLIGLACVSVMLASALSIPVTENGTGIGTITVNTAGAAGSQSMSGSFQAMNNLGMNITLAQLATNLGEDHFNWLQFFTPTNLFLGCAANTTCIDPASGGQGALWADTLPWYWDEVAPPTPLPGGMTSPPTFIPPAGQTELSVSSAGGTPAGSQLAYSDQPGSNAAGQTTLAFTTCLVSVGPGNNYTPLGGFTWSDTVGGSAGPVIGNVTAGPTATAGNCGLTQAQQNLVTNFGAPNFVATPEPGTIMLALPVLACLSLRRRRA